jgi:hypothetical protein
MICYFVKNLASADTIEMNSLSQLLFNYPHIISSPASENIVNTKNSLAHLAFCRARVTSISLFIQAFEGKADAFCCRSRVFYRRYRRLTFARTAFTPR